MTPDRATILRTGPLAILVLVNLAAVVLCAWPPSKARLKFLAFRDADIHAPQPETQVEEKQWEASEAWLEYMTESERKKAIAALWSFQAWLREKPEEFQNRLLSMPPREREDLIERTRQREREGPLAGLIHPSILAESWFDEFREFLSIRLLPRLSDSELAALEKAASGDRKAWLANVARLAHDHLHLPQGPSSVMNRKGLSRDWDAAFQSLAPETRKRLETLEGRWPDFAILLHNAVTEGNGKVPPEPLGPSRWEEMPVPWQLALQSKSPNWPREVEKNRLRALEGQWPAYPRKILEMLRTKWVAPAPIRLPGPLPVWRGVLDLR